ncbi:hypothetical protein DM790_24265 [Flavobacterium collinsii]|nr:hypothetical protein [Flavobacterium collinsii]
MVIRSKSNSFFIWAGCFLYREPFFAKGWEQLKKNKNNTNISISYIFFIFKAVTKLVAILLIQI